MSNATPSRNIINQKIGRNIRTIRKAHKLSRKQIAEYLQVSDISVYKYETGEVSISIDKLLYLTMYFRCELAHLLAGVLPLEGHFVR